MPGRCLKLACAALSVLVLVVTSCGEHGLLPSSVDPGADFVQEDVTFDEQFYYCQVEPMLFRQGCGAGTAGTDPANGCHFSVTKFRLTDYVLNNPIRPELVRVGDGCVGGIVGSDVMVPVEARQNYAAAQARMKRDPNRAALLLRPTGKAQHPRTIFPENSDEAEVIRQWATQFSNQ